MIENIFTFNYFDKYINMFLPFENDHIQKQILNSNSFYEIDLLEEISRFPLKKGIVCDIGANIGNHSIYFSTILKKEVFAFEPNKIVFDILDKNIKLNNLEDKVKIFQVALGSENSFGEMTINHENYGTSYIKSIPNGNINIKRLDDFFSDKNSVSLLKIDVEGFELEVLKGAKEIICNSKPLIVIETQTQRDFFNINNKLQEYGYFPVGQKGATNTVFFIHETDKLSNEFLTYLQRIDNQKYNELNNNRYKEIVKTIKSIDKSKELQKILEELVVETKKNKTSELENNIVKAIKSIDKSEEIKNVFKKQIEDLQNTLLNNIESKNKDILNLNNIIQQKEYKILENLKIFSQIKTTSKIEDFNEEKFFNIINNYVKKLETRVNKLETKLNFIYFTKSWKFFSFIKKILNMKVQSFEEYIEKIEKKDGKIQIFKEDYLKWIKKGEDVLKNIKINSVDILNKISEIQDKDNIYPSIHLNEKNNEIIKENYTLPKENRIKDIELNLNKNNYDYIINLSNKNLSIEEKYALNIIVANYFIDNESIWEKKVNSYLEKFKIFPIKLKTSGISKFHKLSSNCLYKIKEGPLVSIIMPVFNSENTIKVALESLLNQTYENIEIIIINDNSSDLTNLILDSYALKDNRIKIIKNLKNVGPYVSKNIALELCLGKYITGQDADDWSHPQRIEKQVNVMEESKGDIKLCQISLLKMKLNGKINVTGETIYSEDGITKPSPISSMFDKEFFKEKIGYWDSVRFGADSELIERVKKIIPLKSYVFIKDCLMFCLESQDSLTSNIKSGIPKTVISLSRKHYIKNYTNYHEKYKDKSLYIPFPHFPRFFDSLMDVKIQDIFESIQNIEYKDNFNKRYEEIKNNENIIMKTKIRNIPYMEKKINIENSLKTTYKDKPLISVIMTTYNTEKFVENAILSILNQTYENLELIIIDDSSTDNTINIIEKLQKKDKRILLFCYGENKGTYWAKNYGITKSTGEIITFMDSDDVSDQKRLEKQFLQLNNENTIMTTCNLIRKDELGNVLEINGKKERIAPISKMFKKELIDNIGFFDTIRTSADDEFIQRIKLVYGKETIKNIKEVLYYAIVRENSLTTEKGNEIDLTIKREENQTFLPFARQNYLDSYQEWHKDVKNRNLSPYVPFPIVCRPFPVYGKLRVKEDYYDNNYISVCIASFPPREEKLKKVIMDLRNKVDFIYVYLNDYKEIPKFLDHPRIQVVLSSNAIGDLRDNGKMYFMDIIPNGYCFTIDDDINYPTNYIEKMIQKIELYERKAIIGIHGTIFANPYESYFKNRTVYHFNSQLKKDVLVNQLGTGTIGFHTSLIRPHLEDFLDVGMADVFIAMIAKNKDIPLVCIERNNKWLSSMDANEDENNLYQEFKNNTKKQDMYISTILPFSKNIENDFFKNLKDKGIKYGLSFKNQIFDIEI